MMRQIGTAAFLVLCATLSGCNPEDKSNLGREGGQFVKTAGEALGNAGLAGKVNGVLSVWKGVEMSGWEVQAKGDTVTLTGTVRNQEERARIVNVVKQIRGVEKVENKLEVTK